MYIGIRQREQAGRLERLADVCAVTSATVIHLITAAHVDQNAA
jgi:hypothetical protein